MIFETPHLSGKGFTIVPEAMKIFIASIRQSLIVQNSNEVWNLRNFNSVRKPIVIGSFASWKKLPRILDLPIKIYDSEYRLPEEVRSVQDLVQNVANFEHEINPAINKYCCYLTTDQGWVEPGETQRRKGCHVDGFQGARIQPKQMINRSYIVSDRLPTVFYPHPFKTDHLDESIHNFFLDFDRQANENLAWRSNPNEVVLSDAYMVHRSDVAKERIFRTFVRISYDTRRFDRLGNTHNPLFDYNWEMIPRDVQKTLKEYNANGKNY